MFSLVNQPEAGDADLSGLKLSRIPVDTGRIKHDLMVWFEDEGSRLTARWKFDADLFDAAARTAMLARYRAVLELIVEDPSRPLAELAPRGREAAALKAR